MDGKIFVTAAGVELKVKAINRFKVDAIFGRLNKVRPPTYEVEIAGGGKEVLEHTEQTIQTDEERAAWDTYIKELARVQAEVNHAFVNLIMLDGIDFEIPAGWEDQQKFLGIEVPANPFERKVHYIFTELMTDDQDFPNLCTAILQLGRTNMEAAADVAKGFRAGMEELANRKAGEQQSALEGEQPDLQRIEDSVRVESDAGAVV